ncbi:hypothetical protein NQ317_015427 [Molorchus minor]|uniref:Uncharacterized protein n=1 Tax=Molorchus minor TaxID=1323400 RepID=A0ABQ9IV66_9CUCU|nr:hypothetical protein NQ317_015427 [Molorchus minor]
MSLAYVFTSPFVQLSSLNHYLVQKPVNYIDVDRKFYFKGVGAQPNPFMNRTRTEDSHLRFTESRMTVETELPTFSSKNYQCQCTVQSMVHRRVMDQVVIGTKELSDSPNGNYRSDSPDSQSLGNVIDLTSRKAPIYRKSVKRREKTETTKCQETNIRVHLHSSQKRSATVRRMRISRKAFTDANSMTADRQKNPADSKEIFLILVINMHICVCLVDQLLFPMKGYRFWELDNLKILGYLFLKIDNHLTR